MLASCRVAFRLGSAFARHDVHLDAPLCHADRRWYRSRGVASHSIRHVVLPAVGAMDLRYLSRHCIAYEPVPGAPLFSIHAAILCCSGRPVYPAADRRRSCDVFSATSA